MTSFWSSLPTRMGIPFTTPRFCVHTIGIDCVHTIGIRLENRTKRTSKATQPLQRNGGIVVIEQIVVQSFRVSVIPAIGLRFPRRVYNVFDLQCQQPLLRPLRHFVQQVLFLEVFVEVTTTIFIHATIPRSARGLFVSPGTQAQDTTKRRSSARGRSVTRADCCRPSRSRHATGNGSPSAEAEEAAQSSIESHSGTSTMTWHPDSMAAPDRPLHRRPVRRRPVAVPVDQGGALLTVCCHLTRYVVSL